MQAYISGEAGYAAILKGNKVTIYDVNSGLVSEDYNRSHLNLLFAGTDRTSLVKVKDEKDAFNKLKFENTKDKSLMLLLMLLDKDESSKIKNRIPEVLEEYIENPGILVSLEKKMFSDTLKEVSPIGDLDKLTLPQKRLNSLIKGIYEHQDAISVCRENWEKINAEKIGIDNDTKLQIENVLIKNGIFKELSEAIQENSKSKLDKAKFKLLSDRDLKNVATCQPKALLDAWLEDISISDRTNFLQNFINTKKKTASNKNHKLQPTDVAADHQAYKQTLSQIQKVKQLLSKGQTDRARRFAIELMNQQKSREDFSHAAMSLCQMTRDALRYYSRNLAVELAQYSTELAPEDNRVWLALAEAHIHSENYKQAIDALEKLNEPISYSDSIFMANAKSKIAERAGNLGEAISICEDFIEKQSNNNGEIWHSFLRLADLSLKVGASEKAKDALEKATEVAPSEPNVVNAFADYYKKTGNIELSKRYYDRGIKNFDSIELRTGLSGLYRDIGEYEESLKIARHAIRKFESEPTAYREEILTYISKGDFKNAKKKISHYKVRFPFDYFPYVQNAYLLVDQSKILKAKTEFKIAENNIETDFGFRLIYSRFLKAIGEFKESLRSYRAVLTDSPYNTSAQIGIAELYKSFGRFDIALKEYDKIQTVNLVKSVSIDAIKVASGDYESILSRQHNFTNIMPKSEWVRHHIYAMALLKSGKTEEAEQQLNFGLANNPFIKARGYYKTALAISKLKSKKYSEAISELSESNSLSSKTPEERALDNIIYLHAYAGINDIENARKKYKSLKSYCPQIIVPLRDELAAQIGLNDNDVKKSREWTINQECNILAIFSSTKRAA